MSPVTITVKPKTGQQNKIDFSWPTAEEKDGKVYGQTKIKFREFKDLHLS